MNAAVIVAAGRGLRMGFDKLMAPLAGEPVILHTLRAFAACPDIGGVWVVAGEERAAQIRAAAGHMEVLRGVVPGGAERHDSVYAGLRALPPHCRMVAVHDGARPLIHPAQISRCLAVASSAGAAASARRITDTVKRADAGGTVTGSVDRDGLWAMETPQVFKLELLMAAYLHITADGLTVTDEVSAVAHLGHPVQLVENLWPNMKITLPGDLDVASLLLRGSRD